MVKARSRILGRFLTDTGILFLMGFQNLPAFGQLATPELTTPELTADEPADRMQQGKAFYQAGQITQAIAVWQQAADRYQASGDALNYALTLSYLALASQQLGQWSEAKEKTQRAIATLDAIAPNSTPQNSSQRRLIRAQVLNTQASLQFAQGQVETALATWTEAGASYAQVGTASQKVGNLINQAQAQQSLGLLLRAQQTLTQVEQHLQSLPDSPLKAMGWRSLGNGRMITGQSREAEQALQKSLAIAERLSLPVEQSAALISLANVARVQEQRSGGKGSAEKESAAIALYQRAAQLKVPPLLQLQAQLNHLSLLIQTDRISEAQALAAKMQPQLEQLPASRASVQARINFAESVRQLPDQSSDQLPDQSSDRASPVAATMLAAAVQQARSLGDRPSESQALGYLGRLYEQRQQWSAAKKLTEQALVLAQVVNTPEIAYQWQWQLGRILKAKGEVPAATQSYWAAFKTLQSVRGDLGATNPELQFSFRERVEPVYRELVDLLLQPNATGTQTGAQTTAAAQMNLKQAREVIESLRLAELDNFFRTACLEGQTVAIDAVQQTDAAVIYPIILANRLEVIVSLPGQPLRHYATTIPQHQVETTLEQWRRELEKPLTSAESKRLGQQVYDWLVRPVATELQARSLKTLVFVLDGSLRSVPMAALYDGQQYLIERHSVALTPGLRLLKPQPLQNQGLSTLFAGLTQERHGFRALSYVEQELQEIQAEVSSRSLLNQQFTSAQLQTQLQARPSPIVHLATHGQFSSNADETFVLAWDKPIRVKELSLLLRDREDLQTQAIELLVLSACETAEGDKRAALGLAGVAVQAGARSTLASLWSLDDESGARFVGPFYRELAKGNISKGNVAKGNVSKAEALRQAQLSLLRDPDFRHPRYWAPYVLLGNWL